MCAIYKYGNDDALRVNVFFLLSFQFDAFCFLPILAATIWLRMVLPISPCSFIDLELLVLTYFFFYLFRLHMFLRFAFWSRIYIVMASLLNGMLDILLDFHDVCPWNFIYFISLSSFYCRDIWRVIGHSWWSRRRWETMEIGHKVSFIILVFWCFIIVFVVWLFIVLSSVFYLFILHPASCICILFIVCPVNWLLGWHGWI